MKIAFLALFNMVHDAGYRIMKEKGLDVIPYLKRAVRNIYNEIIYLLIYQIN